MKEGSLAEHLSRITLSTFIYAGTEDNAFNKVRDAAGVMANMAFVALDRLDRAVTFRQSQIVAPQVRPILDRAA